jgi:processive 1,2-diacylglycerol beta-glucosyltransferase
VTSRVPARRILLLHASVGGGHTRAAEAIAEACAAAAEPLEVTVADYNDLVPAWQRAPVQALYRFALGHLPALWRRYYRHTNRPAPTVAALALASAGIERTAALLDRVDPDLVISTFTGSAALVGAARTRRSRPLPHAVVATDFHPHRHWVRSGVDLFCAPSAEARVDLVRLGAPAERVTVTGLPIRRAAELADRAAARAAVTAQLGLDDRPILLVAAGAQPTPRARRMVSALAELTQPAQLLICFDAPLPRARPGVSFHRVGLRDDFPRLLAACDLLVGKSGGATVAEACALGRPLLVVDPYPGQEEDNADWLLRHGAARRVRDLGQLATAVDALVAAPGVRAMLARAAARLSRPGAAARVVERALGLLRAPRAPIAFASLGFTHAPETP